MSRLVLVGGGGKRTAYFQRAALAEGVPLFCCSWEEYPARCLPGDIVKLDPPPFEQTALDRLPAFAAGYCGQLRTFASFAEARYLNDPLEILAALDKTETRRRLLAGGVPVPRGVEAADYPALCRAMAQSRLSRVFLKPRFGSGASGVLAYARAGHREVLHTSLGARGGVLCNTKRIHTYREPSTIRSIVNTVLEMGAVAEQWVPKTSAEGISYDLRALWQNGEVLATIPRGSQGPITNLHLNNLALDIQLPESTLDAVSRLCAQAMACFPGLRCAGIDVLLPKGGGAPLILEVNAQGDLLYRDIYAENRVYRSQVQLMKGWRT